MPENRVSRSITGLQWTVVVVVLAESLRFVLSLSAAHAFARTGLPDGVRMALGGAEILAALLFLIPRTAIGGGIFLVVILALASLVHILHGWWDVGGLVVDAAAVLAVIAQKRALAGQTR